MKKQKIAKKTLVGIMIGTIFSSLIISSAPAQADTDFAAEPQVEECLPAILFLRGSDEQRLNTTEDNGKDVVKYFSEDNLLKFTTNGHEGPVIGNLLKAYAKAVPDNDLEDKVRFIGIDYTSLKVFPDPPNVEDSGIVSPILTEATYAMNFLKHIFNYYDSFTNGAEETANFIANDKDENGNPCETQYMLVGYSQGAISVRLALNLLNGTSDLANNMSEKIVNTYVFGDPWQQGGGAMDINKSLANTSSETDGVGRIAMGHASDLAFWSTVAGMQNDDLNSVSMWGQEIMKSDSTIYRDKSQDGLHIYSRSLCHYKDPTCTVVPFDMGEHLNYFNPVTDPGSLDIALEIPGFSNQIEQLINSNYVNNQERILKQTPSVEFEDTIYNVVHSKTGDSCSWDNNSDGSYEVVNVDCRGTHKEKVTESTAKMTVKIRTSNGEDIFLSTESSAAKASAIDDLMQLKLDKWYQFHPNGQPDQCVSLNQSDNQKPVNYADEEDENGNLIPNDKAVVSSCANESATDFSSLSTLGKHSFKMVVHDIYKEKLNAGHFNLPPGQQHGIDPSTDPRYKPVRKMANGYNENFYLGSDSPGNTSEAKIKAMKYSNRENALIPSFVKVEDGKFYYTIRSGANCLALNNNQLNIESGCSNENQLFSVTALDENLDSELSEKLGQLSLEQDTTPPTAVTNVQVSSLSENLVTLTWNPSVDNRNGQVRYYIENLLENENGSYITEFEGIDTSESWWINDTSATFKIHTPEGAQNKFKIVSVDTAANINTFGADSEVSFDTPYAALTAPSAPNLYEINYNPNSVTMTISGGSNATSFDIYKNGALIATTESSIYTDYDVVKGGTYNYAYKIHTNEGRITPISQVLTVNLESNIAPSAPNNLIANNQWGTSDVLLSWTPTVDDNDLNLKYSIFRNGHLIANEIYDYNYTDTGAPDGLNVYKIKAVDSEGFESEYSVSTSIEVAVDITPPSKPILEQVSTTTNSVGFFINSYDDVSSNLYYKVFRNGSSFYEGNSPDFFDTGLLPGASYNYSVISVDEFGNESDYSDNLTVTMPSTPVINPPTFSVTTPTDLQNIYVANNVAYFGWQSNNNMGFTFEIYRNGQFIGTTWDTYYIDKNVSPNTTYQYFVVARNWQNVKSANSEQLSITTTSLSDTPDTRAPSNFKLGWSSGNGKTISLNWSPSVDDYSDVTYKVYKDGTFLKETPSTSIFYTVDTLEVDTPAVFTVKAYDSVGNETTASGSFAYTWNGTAGPMCEPNCNN